jgi:hypothetical protein
MINNIFNVKGIDIDQMFKFPWNYKFGNLHATKVLRSIDKKPLEIMDFINVHLC